MLATTTAYYQDALGGTFASGVNPLLFGAFPDLAYDTWLTIGISGTPNAAAGEGAIQSAQSPNQNWILGFEAGGDIVMDDPVGGAWFVTNVYTNGIAGDDLEVLLGQFTTTDGDLSGTLNYQVFIHGDGDTDLRHGASFPRSRRRSGAACGCTDEEADNYDATAVYDDGSCFQAGCTDAVRTTTTPPPPTTMDRVPVFSAVRTPMR